jgi:hypothetical protein
LLAIWRAAAVKSVHAVGQVQPRCLVSGPLRNPSPASKAPTRFAQKRIAVMPIGQKRIAMTPIAQKRIAVTLIEAPRR